MTNPAPAPQPDLRQRIAEIFPCICTPPFEDGAHWHDCPTGFRQAVEKLVNEFVESEVTLLEQRDTEWRQAVSIGIGASWISVSEAPTFAARVSDDIADMVWRHDGALRTQVDEFHACTKKIQGTIDAAFPDSRWSDFDVLDQGVALLRRERDEAREKLARAQSCEESWRREWREGKNAPEKRQHQLFGKLEAAGELECALGAESPRKDAAEGRKQ